MIRRSEVKDLSEKLKVPTATIDKDWVLGHVVAALARQPLAKEKMIFKGGTCLRKCYFPDYRFSEDLDYTLIDDNFQIDELNINQILTEINGITGILFLKPTVSRILYKNNHLGYSIDLKYWGSDHRRDQPPPVDRERWMTRIKIEMTWRELICFPVNGRPLYHEYSDLEFLKDILVPCYHLNEVVCEKLRSLIQRSYPAPRDYYDLWYLSRNAEELDWNLISEALKKKAGFKSVEYSCLDDFFRESRMIRSERAWKSSLGAHLPAGLLPGFDESIRELREILKGRLKIT